MEQIDMTTSYQDMCAVLKLNPEIYNLEHFKVLEEWCHKNISSDLTFPADAPETSYKKYLHLARGYLDTFLPETKNSHALHNGMSAIQYAAYNGYDHFLKHLNSPQDSWSATTEHNVSALHLAATRGYLNTVKIILEKDSSPQKLNNCSQYPLYSTLLVSMDSLGARKENREQIFQLLLGKEPHLIAHQEYSGETVLHLMATHGFPNLAKDLLEKNPTLASVADEKGIYPIHKAILNNQHEMLKILLKIKGSAHLKGQHHQTILHYAAAHGTVPMLEQCYQKNNQLNVVDRNGKTPLIVAVQSGNSDAAQFLLAKGADVNPTDNSGYSALHYAVLKNNLDMVRTLLEHPALDIEKMGPPNLLRNLAQNEEMGNVLAKKFPTDSPSLHH